MAHTRACPRVSVERCPAKLPVAFMEAMEHNQKIKTCCRHPENHDIEAFYSCDDAVQSGAPDIYVFHCKCGSKHTRFMGGGSRNAEGEVTHPRPFWDIR